MLREARQSRYMVPDPTQSRMLSADLLAFALVQRGAAETKLRLWQELSPREREVLDRLSRGYRYREIADALRISVPTVNTYIRRIYEKLHVQSRAQAIAKYAHHPVGDRRSPASGHG